MNGPAYKDKGPHSSGPDFDREGKPQSKQALLDYIPNFALDNLVALIGLSLSNTEEEQDCLMILTRRRAADRAATLPKTKKLTKSNSFKRKV